MPATKFAWLLIVPNGPLTAKPLTHFAALLMNTGRPFLRWQTFCAWNGTSCCPFKRYQPEVADEYHDQVVLFAAQFLQIRTRLAFWPSKSGPSPH